MATSSTLENILDQLIDECRWGPNLEDGLGLKVTANVSGSTTFTVTHAELNRLGASQPTTRLQGWYAWASDNDQERMITTLSTSGGTTTVTVSGANFTADASSTLYILRFSVATLIAIANDALAELTVECKLPLAHGPTDYDLQDSDTVDASWVEANATDAVQTTAAEVWAGARSLVVTDSGSGGGYAASGTVRAGHGKTITAHAIAKSDTGTSALRVLDDGGNTEATVSFTQEDWLYIRKEITLGASDEGVTLRLLESTASAAGDWQFAWVVKHDARIFNLPSWADGRFRIKAVSRAIFPDPGDEADTWMADSVDFKRLREGEDYRFADHQADANPHAVIFERHISLSDAYFVHIECPWTNPYGVAATLALIGSTTLCPLRLLMPYMKMLVGQRCGESFQRFEAEGTRELRRRQGQMAANRPRPEIVIRRAFG